ncbi:MAG: lamin tail domain-containing protein [Lentisphaerae bacterium]|nr:lamin tail domain-containing protein [Lentisphaerota bacterium]
MTRLCPWSTGLIALLLLAAGAMQPAHGDIIITEFMAINETKYTDANTNYPDWIELRNTTTFPPSGSTSLDGWYLTDDRDNLTKWRFPATNVVNGRQLIVFASGSTNSVIRNQLHANFKLDGDGEYLALVKPDGTTITSEFSPKYPKQYRDVSYGLSLSSPTGQVVYFSIPTPGAANNAGQMSFGPAISNVVHTPQDPPDASDIWVSAALAHPAGGGVATGRLHYVVMYGSLVTVTMADDGAHHDGAAADGVFGAMIPAAAATTGQMVRYAVSAIGNDGSWSRSPATNDIADYYGTVIYNPALATNPPVLHWFSLDNSWENAGPSAGTWYTWTDQPGAWGSAYLYYDGEFYAGCRVRNKGSSTITAGLNKYKVVLAPGHKFRYATDQPRVKEFNIHRFVGDSAYMREPLATDAMKAAGVPSYNVTYIRFLHNGATETASIVEQQDETFLERNGYDPAGALYKADPNKATEPEKCSDLSLDWQNPEVYGLYNKESRSWEDQGDLNVLRTNLAAAAGSDSLKRYLFDNVNLPQVLNQMAVAVVIGHGDRCEKNYYVYRDSDGTREWSMFPWDFDTYIFLPGTERGGIQETGYGTAEVRSIFYGDYGNWTTFRSHSWLRWSYPSAPLHDGKYTNSYNRLYDAIIRTPATREMYLRRLRTVTDQLLGPTAPGYLENRIDDFDAVPLTAVNAGNLKSYCSTRRGQLYSNTGEFTNIPPAQPVSPPIQFGAIEPSPASGFEDQEYLELLNTNAIAVDISGWALSNGVDFVFQSGTVIPARSNLFVSPRVAAFRAREVSPRSNEACFVQGPYRGRLAPTGDTVALYDQNRVFISSVTYTGAPPAVYSGPLRVTEVMAHPPAPAAEFIEVCNTGGTAADLRTLRFTAGVTFEFASATVTNLDPGQYALVVRDRTVFTNTYAGAAGMRIAGQYTGSLNDGGETLALYDTAQGADIFRALYQSARGWPVAADGTGHSLVPQVMDHQADGRLDYGGHWRASAFINGSPGAADPAPPRDVVLNEFMAHTDYTNDALPEYDSNDWIELFNTTGTAQDLTSWFLSDNPGNLRRWPIPAGTTIAAGGWQTFDEVTGFHSPITNGFGTDKAGGALYLSYLPGGAADRVADAWRYKGQENFISEGRYPDGGTYGYALTPTTNAANAAPGPRVVVSRIHYHPAPTVAHPEDNLADEYVELHNAQAVPQPLWSEAGPWRLDGAASYTFPSNTTLAAGAHAMLVSFDPTDTATRDAFLAANGLELGSATLFGPFNGQLSNHGERLALERPLLPDLPGDPVIWVIADEVIYFDAAPWPAGADGAGPPLTRLQALAAGNDPANWTDGSAPPDPDGDGDGMRDVWEDQYFGSTNAPGGEPQDDMDRDGFSNIGEYTAGTDPTDDADVFAVEIGPAGATVLVSFVTVMAGPDLGGAVRYYSLESLPDLSATNWLGVEAYTNILGTNQTVQYHKTATTNPDFYRGRVWLQQP